MVRGRARLALKVGKSLVLRGRRRVSEGRLAQVETHLACLAREGGKEAVAHGVGGELEDDAVGGESGIVTKVYEGVGFRV